VAGPAEQPAPIGDFVIRRLHSLLGIIPVGTFVLLHLTANMLVASNTPDHDYYQEAVDRIHGLGPFLIPTEILFIFVPLALHAGLGVKIWLEGKPNTRYYPYWGNARYMLQRLTGVVALIFILVHVWHMHWVGSWLPGGSQFDPERATLSTAAAMQRYWWAAPLYAIGVVSTVFHLANGIWAFLITWGITIGPRAQRGAGYVCTAIGIMLTLAGFASIRALVNYPLPRPPEQIEVDYPGPSADATWGMDGTTP
jgi:succinate dehydrogenase / fumarate reductase cytochrome b subunit